MSAGPRPAVVVFCKAPVPGRTKTRLVPEFSSDQAAALGTAMLLDVAGALTGGPWDLVASVAAPEDRGAIAALVPPDCRVTVQSPGDLGRRMRLAIRDELAAGHPAVALVGADCPEVTPEHLEAAFTALARAEVAISPAGDGGYALIAAAADLAPIFAGIAWSTERVMDMTRAAARVAGIRLAELSPLPDVDRPADVARLAGEPLQPSRRAARSRAVASALADEDQRWHSRVESANSPPLY